MKNKISKRIAIALAAVGPGLFLIGYNIGTGSVTTMAKRVPNLAWNCFGPLYCPVSLRLY